MDPFFNRYYLAVKYSSSAWFDRLIIYDWGLGEFTQISNAVGILFPVASGMLGYTLEGLSAVSASLDALPFSLDSKVWQGGAPVMAAIDSGNKLGFYSGDNAEATITTQEFGATDGSLTRITEAMPVIDTQSALLSLGARMRRSADDVVVWTAEGAQSANTGDRSEEEPGSVSQLQAAGAGECGLDARARGHPQRRASGGEVS
jgi:hypothetical protein